MDVALLEAARADGTTQGLERAAALYKGEFLAGLNLNEQAFEEWRAVERERLSALAVEALTGLVDRQALKRLRPPFRRLDVCLRSIRRRNGCTGR